MFWFIIVFQPRCIVGISSNHYHPPGTTLKAGFKILSKYVLLTVCHENLMIIQIIVTNMYHRHFHKAHFDENNYMSWRSFAPDLIADPSNNVSECCIILHYTTSRPNDLSKPELDLLVPVGFLNLLCWQVGRINCPMLLVNGCDEQNWPTVETAEEVSDALRHGSQTRGLGSTYGPRHPCLQAVYWHEEI